jgi:hypothetical protein
MIATDEARFDVFEPPPRGECALLVDLRLVSPRNDPTFEADRRLRRALSEAPTTSHEGLAPARERD